MLGSQRDFAKYLGVSKSMVSKLASQGKLVIVSGKIDFEASKAKIKLHETITNRGGAQLPRGAKVEEKETSKKLNVGKEDISIAKQIYDAGAAKAKHYEGKMKELEFQKKAKEVADVSEVSTLGFDIAKKLRNSLNPIPLRVSPKIATITNSNKQQEIQQLIDKEIQDAINSFQRDVEELRNI